MKIDRLPPSLLQGKNLHCRPVDGGQIIKAKIFDSEDTPTFKKVIVCPARRSGSKCQLRIKAGDGGGYCHYYRGDSRGDYQIIGPGMDEK